MFRSIAQFGAWALARAQQTEIDIMDDDEVSIISSESDSESIESGDLEKESQKENAVPNGANGEASTVEQVGKAGDPLPRFKNHMIRQKVDRHGRIFPLQPESELLALQLSANEIGVIKPGPVRKWMEASRRWGTKYGSQKRKVQKQRIKEISKGYLTFGDDDVPPPSALAGRRGLHMPEEKKKRSIGLSMWSLWGSAHDKETVSLVRCIIIVLPTKCSSSSAKKKPTRIPPKRPSPSPMQRALPRLRRRLSARTNIPNRHPVRAPATAKFHTRTKSNLIPSTRTLPPRNSFSAGNKITTILPHQPIL